MASLATFFDARIVLAALEVADVVGIKAGSLGEYCLCEFAGFAGFAVLAQVQPEGRKDFVTFRPDS